MVEELIQKLQSTENFEEQIEIGGEKALYLKNIAATYSEMGELDEAHKYYDKAYALDQQ